MLAFRKFQMMRYGQRVPDGIQNGYLIAAGNVRTQTDFNARIYKPLDITKAGTQIRIRCWTMSD